MYLPVEQCPEYDHALIIKHITTHGKHLLLLFVSMVFYLVIDYDVCCLIIEWLVVHFISPKQKFIIV